MYLGFESALIALPEGEWAINTIIRDYNAINLLTEIVYERVIIARRRGKQRLLTTGTRARQVTGKCSTATLNGTFFRETVDRFKAQLTCRGALH